MRIYLGPHWAGSNSPGLCSLHRIRIIRNWFLLTREPDTISISCRATFARTLFHTSLLGILHFAASLRIDSSAGPYIKYDNSKTDTNAGPKSDGQRR